MANETPAGWYPAPHANNEQRYWDGTRWSDWTPEQAVAAAAAAPSSGVAVASESTAATAGPGAATANAATDAPPTQIEKKKGLKWWAWVLIGLGALIILIIIISSLNGNRGDSDEADAQSAATAEAVDEEPAVEVPDVIGMTVGEARSAIEGAGLTFYVVGAAEDDWVVTTQNRTVPAPAGSEVLVTASAPEPPAAPEPVAPDVARQEFSGTGDMVIDVSIAAPAIVSFSCPVCERNTVLKANGRESLLVNEIGPYNGSKVINVYDNSMTTQFIVTATGSWTLVVDDISTAGHFSGPVVSSGSQVFWMDDSFTAAAIWNDGASNFTVYAYGSGERPLIVNEIGAYSGTVPMKGPALVEVESTGNWSITPQ